MGHKNLWTLKVVHGTKKLKKHCSCPLLKLPYKETVQLSFSKVCEIKYTRFENKLRLKVNTNYQQRKLSERLRSETKTEFDTWLA